MDKEKGRRKKGKREKEKGKRKRGKGSHYGTEGKKKIEYLILYPFSESIPYAQIGVHRLQRSLCLHF